jgi:hypothetical protein
MSGARAGWKAVRESEAGKARAGLNGFVNFALNARSSENGEIIPLELLDNCHLGC